MWIQVKGMAKLLWQEKRVQKHTDEDHKADVWALKYTGFIAVF
jgi:hypothetical protein